LWYPKDEGNEAGGDEWKGIGVSHSTIESGEPTRRDPEEGRGHCIMDPLRGKMASTSRPNNISTRLQRVAEESRKAPKMVWTTLSHHIDLDLLVEAYRRTRKDGAVGIDGQTAKEYGENLKGNLESLLDRVKSGMYKAPAVKRVYIPKGDGRSRPIGIPTFEDKVLQRAVVMVLEAVYEQDFLDCSYGFRPGRSAHQALDEIYRTTSMHGGYVMDLDIKSFFDTLDHDHLRGFLDKRVRDGVIRRLIDKWLRAGVLGEGRYERQRRGTPQGGVISPLLANIFLHVVLDRWFETEVKPRLQGNASLVRYADDVLLVFSHKKDADRVMEVLPKRFCRFGLELHPEKTKQIDFKRPRRKGDRPGSFDFLGFRHYWCRSRKGNWVVKRKTAGPRFTRALKVINVWCNRNRHVPLRDQHRILNLKLRGHYLYYGLIGNSNSLYRFRWEVRRIWRKWLDRRSQKSYMNWDRYLLILKRYPLLKPNSVITQMYGHAVSP